MRAVDVLAVNEARSWIGTQYVHQHSVKGQAADCLGLIRGVWRKIYGEEPAKLASYTPDWSEVSGAEVLWDAANAHLCQVPVNLDQSGCVLLFRMKQNFVAKHLGILASSQSGIATVIHAYSVHGVVETPLTDSWLRKIVAQYQFPNKDI